MRSQEDRDEQTVVIGTALGVFAVVMAAVVLGLWLIHSVSDIADGRTDTIFGWAAILAGTLVIMNLVRSRNR